MRANVRQVQFDHLGGHLIEVALEEVPFPDRVEMRPDQLSRRTILFRREQVTDRLVPAIALEIESSRVAVQLAYPLWTDFGAQARDQMIAHRRQQDRKS